MSTQPTKKLSTRAKCLLGAMAGVAIYLMALLVVQLPVVRAIPDRWFWVGSVIAISVVSSTKSLVHWWRYHRND